MAGVFTPYSTASSLFGTKPSWIPDELDIQRIQSYQLYQEIYWNVPDIFKVALRGSNDAPIYIPTARTIIDTTNRYVCPSFTCVLTDRASGKPSTASQAAQLILREWMKRERFKPKFNAGKRYNLIQGDWIWHVTADETKAEGSRISLTLLDPGMYFPITDDDDVDKIVGCHLVEQISTPDGPRIRRLTYRKVPRADGLNTITVEDAVFKMDKWEGPEDKPERVIQAVENLPDFITQLPVYHTKNLEEPGNPFGSSEIRGLERIMSGINQTVSDESLALAIMGIGMYATDSSHPVDPKTGAQVPWRLGPGRVVHYDGDKFDKLPGVGSLGESFGEHYRRLWEALYRASSTPEVAVGGVDVSVAQSGIALALQLGPMLAKAGEKNDLVLATHDQMFFDLVTMWFPAYEDLDGEELSVNCTTGDAVPVDRVQKFTELNDMLDRGVIDTKYYREECIKLGYTFPDTIDTDAKAEFEARNPADPFAGRVAEETDVTGEGEPGAES